MKATLVLEGKMTAFEDRNSNEEFPVIRVNTMGGSELGEIVRDFLVLLQSTPQRQEYLPGMEWESLGDIRITIEEA